MKDPLFVARFYVDEGPLAGARWWNDAFDASHAIRRRTLMHWMVGGAVVIGMAPIVCVVGGALEALTDDGDIESAVDALELQRREGWNVGQKAARLVVASAETVDDEGDPQWRGRLPLLAEALAPTDPRLRPYFVPTLFQAVAPSVPGSASLRAALAPMHSQEMVVAFAKGAALAGLLRQAGSPRAVAVVLDLPGPESVAAAAGLSPLMTPVFCFDNWPHPLGVVPAHQTLAAALYHAPTFMRAAQNRSTAASPVFVLDDARLAPYGDQVSQFDNRYVAKLPGADALSAMGVSRLLYVRPAGALPRELDDLNDDFVTYRERGIEVRLLSLGDLQRAEDKTSHTSHYYWGGTSGAHVYFWHSYGWYAAPSAPRTRRLAPTRPPPPPASVAYQPVARPTLFSTRTVGGMAGVGKQKPSGFGRVSVRTSRSSGAVTGVAAGRSGSFGRSRSSYSG